jgi:hypothetical protein
MDIARDYALPNGTDILLFGTAMASKSARHTGPLIAVDELRQVCLNC